MTESQFEELLKQSIKTYGGSYIEVPEEMWKPHTFSKRFERRMQRLIQREKSFYFPLVRTPLRRVITILVTALVAISVMAMSVSAIRNAVIGFISDVFDTHTKVYVDSALQAPETLEELYEITELPEGFELEWMDITDSRNESVYTNGNSYIFFTQHTKWNYTANYNTENDDMQQVTVNGNNGFIIERGDEYNLIWDDGDYVFLIEVTLAESDLLDKKAIESIANSVQKVE